MRQDETLSLNGFVPQVALIRGTVEQFRRELTIGERNYMQEWKDETADTPEDDELYELAQHWQSVDIAAHESVIEAELRIEVGAHLRRFTGLEQCLTLLQTEDWATAQLAVTSEAWVRIEGVDEVGSGLTLTFELDRKAGTVTLDFPGESERARILGPISEAARTAPRPKTQLIASTDQPAHRFSFNEDVLKHPLVVSGGSGLGGVVVGFLMGWLVHR